MRSVLRAAGAAVAALIAACTPRPAPLDLSSFTETETRGERARVLDIYPGVTATIVVPSPIDTRQRVDLILYALPNGNSTAHTIGRKMVEGIDWHYGIQNIGAQTRALRTMGLPQAIVAYLEADTRSWPAWRQARGYDRANQRIVEIVSQIRAAIGAVPDLHVTLAGHSGGGSFMFGFIEGGDTIPSWIERIAFLDANYNFEPGHGEKLVKWLRADSGHTLVVLAYDDRNIMLDGKKVVSDSSGTWRASERMMSYMRQPFQFRMDTLGEFRRYRAPQVEVLLHPNPENRILHTTIIGEMNGYMHAMLVRRPQYDRGQKLLESSRAYGPWTEDSIALPPAAPPGIPARSSRSVSGTEFIASVARLSREEREAAIKRELLAGNLPGFIRNLRTVNVTFTGADSVKHTASFQVMPDYLSIGSDDNFVRVPMSPYTAQAFCDAYGFVLPTRKMVNDIWAAADTHIDPRPLTVERESPLTFLEHHGIIEDQLKTARGRTFVAGTKKDVVVTNKLLEKSDRVAIYGWHYVNGQPIQPLYTGHVGWYVDYSHGVRPVRRMITVDGVPRTYETILADSTFAGLLSDEGVVTAWRYDK